MSKSPPHIIVILADDLGWNEVSWHNPAILTPNMEVTLTLESRFIMALSVAEAERRGRAADPVLHHAQVLPQQGRPHDRPLPMEAWHSEVCHSQVLIKCHVMSCHVMIQGSSLTVSTPVLSCCPPTSRRQATPPTQWGSGTWGTATQTIYQPGNS